MVDSEACYGVRWHCKNHRTFTIPWVNQKTSVWKDDYSQLFTEYAKHRGKLPTEGKIDYPKCKQNFKSALGKKSQAVKCTFKGKDKKKFRIYKFLADYSSSGRDGGRDQQTRKQSSIGGVDMDGICNVCEEFGDVVASEVSGEEPCLPQADKEGESSVTDFLHDASRSLLGDANTFIPSGDLLGNADTLLPSGDLLENADTLMSSGSFHETVQGDSNLGEIIPQGDETSVIEILRDLNLSPFANNSVAESSQIQNTTVDSTTENQNSSLEFTDDGLNLDVPLQASYNDPLEGNREISTQLTNSKISVSGCITTLQMDRESTQLLLSQVGNARHETIVCNNSGFINSTMGVEKNQLVVLLNPSSRQSLPSSSPCMDTSAEEKSDNQTETAPSVTVSSSTAPEMAGPQSLTLSAPSVKIQGLMFIQVIYTSPQRVVKKQFIASNKCKIFFGRVDNKRLQAIIEKKDEGAVLVELPTTEDFDFEEESKRRISKTLERMELGVVISYRDDDIYVVRRCQSHVYLTDGVSTSDSVPRSRMKEPDTEIKVFDFAMFEKSVKDYESKKESVGRDYFVLTLGCEILKNDPAPTRVVPIRIDVLHLKARAMRFETLGPAAFAPDPQHSISDSFDNALHLSNFPMSM